MDIAPARLASRTRPSPEAENIRRSVLGNGSLLRGVYRALLYQGRSYAAFSRPRVLPLVEKLATRGEILDPMAGYGSLLSLCAECGASSYCLEKSIPLFLWQVLVHPANSAVLARAVHTLLSLEYAWPQADVRAAVSDDWFPGESWRLLASLFGLCHRAIEEAGAAAADIEALTLALLIPFSGRLAAWVPASAVTSVKQGGMCVYFGWAEDLKDYLLCLQSRLEHVESTARSKAHTIQAGDCGSFVFDRGRYGAMITAPPSVQGKDLAAVFLPEDACLSWLASRGLTGRFRPRDARVAPSAGAYVVRSDAVRRFLAALREGPGCDAHAGVQAFYASYFAGLERAYENLAPSLSESFEGYIIVADEAQGERAVPVSTFTVETWRRLGFAAEVYDTRESLGTDRQTGRTECTIKVWRR